MTGSTFTLHRSVDPSSVSGTGVIAEGVEFTDGTVALRWLSATPTTTVFNDVRDVLHIHGHNGLTELVWDTPTQYTPTAQPTEPDPDEDPLENFHKEDR